MLLLPYLDTLYQADTPILQLPSVLAANSSCCPLTLRIALRGKQELPGPEKPHGRPIVSDRYKDSKIQFLLLQWDQSWEEQFCGVAHAPELPVGSSQEASLLLNLHLCLVSFPPQALPSLPCGFL